MIECDWSTAPQWAGYFILLEGNRSFWSSREIKEIAISPVLSNDELPNMEDVPEFYNLRVLQCIPRPKWKTVIHFKENGKLTTYETEGMLSHNTVMRQLSSELGVDKNKRVVLEYRQIN